MKNLRAIALMLSLLLIPVVGVAVTTLPHTRPLPPLPDSIPSQLGWVRVNLVPDLMCNDGPAYGCFSPDTRTLSLRAGMPLNKSWQVLEHERIHVILDDAGSHLNPPGLEDHIATVIGSARVLEMQTAPE